MDGLEVLMCVRELYLYVCIDYVQYMYICTGTHWHKSSIAHTFWQPCGQRTLHSPIGQASMLPICVLRTCSGVPGWLVTLYALRKTAGMSAGSACMAWITVSTTGRMARFGTRRPAMAVISSTKLSSLQRWWPDTIAVPASSGGRGRGYASSSSSSYSTCGRYTHGNSVTLETCVHSVINGCMLTKHSTY